MWLSYDNEDAEKLGSRKVSTGRYQKYTITVVGCTGSGKSTTANVIATPKGADQPVSLFDVGSMSTESVTQSCKVFERDTKIFSRIIDTPGLGDAPDLAQCPVTAEEADLLGVPLNGLTEEQRDSVGKHRTIQHFVKITNELHKQGGVVIVCLNMANRHAQGRMRNHLLALKAVMHAQISTSAVLVFTHVPTRYLFPASEMDDESPEYAAALQKYCDWLVKERKNWERILEVQFAGCLGLASPDPILANAIGRMHPAHWKSFRDNLRKLLKSGGLTEMPPGQCLKYGHIKSLAKKPDRVETEVRVINSVRGGMKTKLQMLKDKQDELRKQLTAAKATAAVGTGLTALGAALAVVGLGFVFGVVGACITIAGGIGMVLAEHSQKVNEQNIAALQGAMGELEVTKKKLGDDKERVDWSNQILKLLNA